MNDMVKVKPMQSGELDLRKAFEQTTRTNVQACVDFTNDTRRLVMDLNKEVKHLSNVILTRDKEVQQLKSQLANLQQKVYLQGT